MRKIYLKRLKQLREDKDYTQKYIAEYLHIHRENYILYENGKRTIPIELLIKLCKLYNVSSDYILEIDKNNNIKILHKMLILQNEKYIIVNK